MSDPTTEAILDATRASLLDFGVRRTTLTDIARRASVSRMTVYRRYPDVDAILRDLMTREFSGLMEALVARVEGADGRERIRRLVLAGVRELREHPLLAKVLEAEPELLLPYVLGAMGGSQRHALTLMERAIAAGQADGSIRAGNARLLATALLLVTQSFVFSAHTAEGLEATDLDGELDRVVDATLAPERG
jgi:AcrR family transcriptional regulator